MHVSLLASAFDSPSPSLSHPNYHHETFHNLHPNKLIPMAGKKSTDYQQTASKMYIQMKKTDENTRSCYKCSVVLATINLVQKRQKISTYL